MLLYPIHSELINHFYHNLGLVFFGFVLTLGVGSLKKTGFQSNRGKKDNLCAIAEKVVKLSVLTVTVVVTKIADAQATLNRFKVDFQSKKCLVYTRPNIATNRCPQLQPSLKLPATSNILRE